MHPVLKVVKHGFYLRLLQHELGNHGTVKLGSVRQGRGRWASRYHSRRSER